MVPIKLHPEIETKVKVVVEKEGGDDAPAEEAPAAEETPTEETANAEETAEA